MEVSRESIAAWLKQLQQDICAELEKADGKGKFREDIWQRNEGGGGITKIISNGNVIEKGGVLFSEVHGNAPEFLLKESEHALKSAGAHPQFYATGVSIVIHPENPFVPIIHMNIRYFEMSGGVEWLGGGIDLTPHYINEDDARYFHGHLKKLCDKHQAEYYHKFKTLADDYFFIKHRSETRGIGGIFFDRLNSNIEMDFTRNFEFWKDTGKLFAPLYTELMNRHSKTSFGPAQKQWQLLRRGRYVEFNLIYDKGTKFGLESGGRVESILMSLPKLAGWEYDFKPEKNSPEEKTLSLLRKGINWA